MHALRSSNAYVGAGFKHALLPGRDCRCRAGLKPAPTRSCPRVAAAREEAVLVVVGGGFAGRFDGADLGESRLHRGTLADGGEPAREIGMVVPFDALCVVIARPWKGRDIGNGIILPAEIARLAEPLVQELVEPLQFGGVAGSGILSAFRR